MIPPKLALAKKTPGIYMAKDSTAIIFIRISDTGEIHQLNPVTYADDGVLSDEGWPPMARKLEVFRLEEIK